ncbi:MAG: NTP transferase domain-containing protein [Actinomycetota bacterium]
MPTRITTRMTSRPMTSRPTVIAVLLAAGGGRRYAGPTHKLMAPLPATPTRPAEPVIARSLAAAVDAVLDHPGGDHHPDDDDRPSSERHPDDDDRPGGAPPSGIAELVVVTGAIDVDDVIRRVARDAGIAVRRRGSTGSAGSAGNAVHVVHNPAWADGQATSVHLGLQVADELGGGIAVVGLGDQPGVTSTAWRRVGAAAGAPGASALHVATYDGRRGNPVALARSVWADVPATGDEGARGLLEVRADEVTAVPCPGSPVDIDTVEDHRRWQNS